jgi:uncharacterized protein (TIGR02453 family)
MTYFTEDTLTFWRGLAGNNTKAWFDQHRKDYEQHLKDPYQRLATALVEGVRSREPEYGIDPKKATYRINRDVRFSNDKTPYKTDLGITIGRSEKHDATWPCYTCKVGVAGIAIAGGLYFPPNDHRDHVRRHVAEHSGELRALAAEDAFVDAFGELGGEAHKRALPDLKEAAEAESLVLNKQWVFWGDFEDPELLLMPDLDEFILDHWDIARPVMEFLKAATRSEASS